MAEKKEETIENKPSSVVSNVKQIANLLDLSESRVYNLARDGIIPREEKGKYNAALCLKAYIRYLRDLAQGKGGMDLTEERTKLVNSQNKKINMELAIKEGEYIKKTEVVEELQQFFIILKRSLLALSRKITTEISGYLEPHQARIVESNINDIVLGALEQMSVNGIYDPKKHNK